MVIILVVFAAACFVVLNRAIRKSRALRSGKAVQPLPSNASNAPWQGNNLGTTIMEPGDLTRIEEGLRSAGKGSEE
jgi:hypothetical protein